MERESMNPATRRSILSAQPECACGKKSRVVAVVATDDGDDRFEAKFYQAVGDDWGVRVRIESLGNEPIVRLPPKPPRAPRAKPAKAKAPKPPRIGRGGKGKGVSIAQLPMHLQAVARAELRKAVGR